MWVAMYRAMESERPDALFKDPYARRLAGDRGEAILKSMPRGRVLAWPMIIRTAVMDEIICRCVSDGTRSVINLAAGLDTRAFRLALPPALRWYDVDLPDMIRYRRDQLASVRSACSHEHVEADLSSEGELKRVLARISGEMPPVLVVTEGLLIYLTEPQVRSLAQQLHARDELRWWLIDLASPQLLQRVSKSWQPHLSAANAPMQFGPVNGAAFFAPLGWRQAEYRSVWEESLRLNRSIPLARIWNLLLKLRSKKGRESARNMSSIVLLQRS